VNNSNENTTTVSAAAGSSAVGWAAVIIITGVCSKFGMTLDANFQNALLVMLTFAFHQFATNGVALPTKTNSATVTRADPVVETMPPGKPAPAPLFPQPPVMPMKASLPQQIG
jgi:hypothetical protein